MTEESSSTERTLSAPSVDEPGDLSPDSAEESAPAAPDGRRGATDIADRPRSRVWLLVSAGVAVLAVLAGIGIWHAVATQQPRSIGLPGVLLGLAKDNGPAAQATVRNMEKAANADSNGLLPPPAAAVYASAAGQWFTVTAGAPCPSGAHCLLGTAQQYVRDQRNAGFTDTRAFPPGPGGGILACTSTTVQAQPVIVCIWIGPATAGKVEFGGGSASGLADAAAKTRQIRAAVER